MTLKISRIGNKSILRKYGISKGDSIIAVNKRPIMNYEGIVTESSNDYMDIRIMKRDGITVEKRIMRNEYHRIDIEFEEKPMMRCVNNCMFCFIDQNPPGLRESLYIKDDDYRLSLQYGNYITLSNLNSEMIEDIISHSLSPLYVSLHSVEDGMRKRIFGRSNPLRTLETLIEAGIEIHAQIVLMRNVNDSVHLERSMEYAREKGLVSTGIVPAGLTQYRTGLPHIESFDSDYFNELIEFVESWKADTGFNRIYIADEIYLASERELPPDSYYNDYPQTDNGIGMVRLFTDTIAGMGKNKLPDRYAVLTGMLFGHYIRENRIIDGHIIRAENAFYGGNVNVTGLLTGSDIINALENYPDRDILITSDIFNEDGFTLDNMTLDDINRQTGRRIVCLDDTRGMEEYLI
ncbi:MAG: DUF512 domain-containing protein [candidate division WOR-3 bacterium]|nr:DUF512 domain-containing protein [candidate division WOR-3 bacterium]